MGVIRYLAKDCADYIINRGGKELMTEDEENIEAPLHTIYSTKKLSELQKKTLPETFGIKDSDFIKIRFNRISPKVK